MNMTKWMMAGALVWTMAACSGSGESEANTTDETLDSTETMEEKNPSVVGKEVSYTFDGLTMNGYMAYDENAEGPQPGILVVHEWWGHNEYARQRAEMLAEMGYVALAVDMYGDGKQADHPEDAGAFAGAVMGDLDAAKGRFEQAMATLSGTEQVDGEKIGAIGYCFGGGVVLAMASLGVDLDAVVSFHGSLPALAPEVGAVTAKVLVCNGADDGFVPQEAIDAFTTNMEAAGADFQFVNYPGAVHSFTSKAADSLGPKFNLPLAYNAEADQQSWQAMTELFEKTF